MRMGEFFSWEEMTYSRRAVEKGLDNRPGAEARKALEHLVLHLLDPLRRLYGKPIAVTSGYRCEEVNRLVGGVPDSQHVKGEAADCYVPDAGELLVVLRRSGLVFDQAIHYRKRNFLHLSLKRSGVNRMQVLVRLVVLCFLATVKLEVQHLHRPPPSLERSGKGGGGRWKSGIGSSGNTR